MTLSDHQTQSVILLDVNILQPNPLQPRGYFDDRSLKDLVDSIKQHGVLEPLVVAHTPAGYQIIAGERRWRAAKLAGLQQVPCLVKETTPQKMLEMAIVENVQREDLNPIERAIAFQRLEREFGLTHEQIAYQIGKSTAYVINSIRLLNLPDALKDGLIAGLITEGHARALVAIPDKQAMIQAYKQVLKENASVRRAEEIARRLKEKLMGIRAVKTTAKWKQELNQMIKVNGKNYVSQNKLPIIEKKLIDSLSKRIKIKPALAKKFKVKLKRTTTRSQLTLRFNGGLVETNEGIKKLLDYLFGSSDWLEQISQEEAKDIQQL